MVLYYSGASKFEGDQLDPLKSLGGYIAGTQIDEQLLNAIFGDITKFTIAQNKAEYRCIVIKNDGIINATNFKVFLQNITQEEGSDSDNDFSGTLADITLANDTITSDSCGDLKTRKSTSSPYATPSGLTFQNVNGENNALLIPNVAPGDYVALWIKRSIKSTAQLPLTNDEYLAVLQGTLVIPTIENLSLKFVWTGD